MSHLSSERRTKMLAGAVVAAAAACTASTVQAAKLVNLTLLGTIHNSGNAYSTTVTVSSASDVIDYAVVEQLSPVGTANSKGTITSLTAGSDGIIGLQWNIFQLATDTIQSNFTSTATLNPVNGGNNYASIGSSGGVLTARGNTFNDLFQITTTAGAGIFNDAVAPGTPATGSFTLGTFLSTGSATIGMKWNAAGKGTFRINGVTSSININNNTENGTGSTDPLVGFTPLNLVTNNVPEPTSLSMLGLASLGLLARRKKA